MNLIQKGITIGAVFYIAVALIQMSESSLILPECVGIAVLLTIAGAITWIQDESGLKRLEMNLLWLCILTFGIYAILRYGGIV